MKDFLRKNRLPLIFGIAGATGGFLYWRFVGCLSGTCPIQSVWYWSTLWGGAVGYLAGDMIKDFLIKREKKRNERTV
jgi:hypothetical protein